MKFDIKDIKTWANRHDVKAGDVGYVTCDFNTFLLTTKVALVTKATVKDIDDNDSRCFLAQPLDGKVVFHYGFFLPVDAVKEDKPEKKYRPLKSIDEMHCLFDCSVMSAKNFLTYRNKTSGKIYIELLFSVCRDKDDILRSINNIPVQNLFNYFEIRKNGEWLPFGVEVKDDE